MELNPISPNAPQAWREVSIDDLKAASDFALSTGPFGSSIGSKFFQEDGVPVIRGSNLSDGGQTYLIDSGFVFLSREKAAEFRRSVVVKGDLVFTCWGTINQVGLISDRAQYPQYIISNKQMKFTPDPRRADSLFLFYLFSGLEFQRQIRLHRIGTSVPGFNLGRLRAIRFSVPGPAEQRAIATALSDVDALLGGLERLIAKKRDLKQAAMQQLLTGQTRLPGFHGEWEAKRLGEVAHIKTGSRNNEDKVADGQYPFYVRSEVVERINSYSHDCEAILVPGEGRIGSIFHYITGRFDVHQRVYAITQFQPDVSARFVHAYMVMHFGAWAMQNTVKATVDSLRLPTFTSFEILVPPTKDEQTAIAAVLSDMDAELAALEARREKTRALKQAMMQELLTGRTRLVPVRGVHA